MKLKHKDQSDEIELLKANGDTRKKKAKDASKHSTLQFAKGYSAQSLTKIKIDDAVVKMICVDMQPIALVEDRGFQSLLSLLDSKYELPSRKKTASLLTKLYSDKYDKLVADLAKIDYVALTSDIWTSRAVQSFQTSPKKKTN